MAFLHAHQACTAIPLLLSATSLGCLHITLQIWSCFHWSRSRCPFCFTFGDLSWTFSILSSLGTRRQQSFQFMFPQWRCCTYLEVWCISIFFCPLQQCFVFWVIFQRDNGAFWGSCHSSTSSKVFCFYSNVSKSQPSSVCPWWGSSSPASFWIYFPWCYPWISNWHYPDMDRHKRLLPLVAHSSINTNTRCSI